MEEIQDRAEVGGPEAAGTAVRLLREIIRTPALAEVIKTNLGSFDQESARELVRTLMHEDVELSVSIAATIPQVLNYLAAALVEFGRQLEDLPEGLGDQYLEELTLGIDYARFREIADVYRSFLERIDFKRAATSVLGKTVNALTEVINSAASSNPYFLRDAFVGVEVKQVFRALLAVAGSAFLWLVSGIVRLFSRS